jgi:hypothetical protein
MPFLRLAALALATLLACSSTPTALNPDATFRVLFVGNSLTYTNDLPRLLQALAQEAGAEPLYVESVAFPNFGLEDHWIEGSARRAIDRGGWRYVIMQQGPSSLPENRLNLIDWSEQFATPIRSAGATPALYTVWPSGDRPQDFDRVVESYRQAAVAVNGLELPAGAAWLAAWRRKAELPLYGGDNFHPSTMGTYLAALTMFGRLYDRSVAGAPRQLRWGGHALDISQADAAVLTAAADEVNGR